MVRTAGSSGSSFACWPLPVWRCLRRSRCSVVEATAWFVSISDTPARHSLSRFWDTAGTDAERMNQLVLGGYLVLQFTYSDIVERPGYVVDRIVEALAALAA